MSALSGTPKWVFDSKDHVSRCPEWTNFIDELYGAIEQQLQESHVEAFSDLTDAERSLFMERAAKAIQGGKAYKDIYSKVSVSLDQHLNNEVARQLLEEFPINTKSDLVLDCALDGAIGLLQKWPDMKSKLHITFNQPLPTGLRQLAWKLFLDNTAVRKTYVDLLKTNPRHAISPLDLEISQRCERLILAEPTFIDIKGSVGAFYAMKATLSYHHARKKSRDSVIDIDYMLVTPFVVAANSKISRRDPAPNHVVALLVEEYLTFMQTRPGFIVDSGSDDHNKEYAAFIKRVNYHLQDRGIRTARVIADKFAPTKEKIIATDTGRLSVLAEGLGPLLRPVIRSMFVGYVNMEVVLFLWDQYIISVDTPGFHEEFLPMVTAIYLMLLHTSIEKSPPDRPLGAVLKQDGIKLKVPQFQYEIHKCFFKDLFAMLNQDNRAAVPVLDPTQSLHPPWMHWFKDVIPGRTTPQDRRQAREEREHERQQQLRRQQDQEREKYAHQLVDKTRDAADLQRAREEERAHNDQLRDTLENALDEEKRARLQAEKAANAEIERLRREVEALQNARQDKMKTPSGMSLESRVSRYLIPPPPTAASHPPTPPRTMKLDTPTPTPRRTPSKQSPSRQNSIKNFLKKIADSFREVAHGSPSQQQQLDALTKEDIKRHRGDIKHAEIEVFGRELKPGEFEALDPDEQESKSDDLMAVIQARLKDYRRKQLRSQKP